MPLFEDTTQVFIVRIWLERREVKDAPVEWRGMIEHLPSGQRRYLKDLAGIVAFMKPYLEEMGAEAGPR
jgi:hypothetical protein